MARCEELSEQECKFLQEIEEVFRRHRGEPVVRSFQIAHEITQRIASLASDEELVMTPDVPGQKKFHVTKRRAGSAAAAGADPCCYWEWQDPPGEFVCVGGC